MIACLTNGLELNMRKWCRFLVAITVFTGMAWGWLPSAKAAELPPRVHVHKARVGHLLSYPYGGTYLRVDLAKRTVGYPYTGIYYGNYYAPTYTYSELYAPPYWNYYDPFYQDSYSRRSGCYSSRRCSRALY